MSDKPNFLWIVTDHLAHGNRPNRASAFKIRSRLAQEGMGFGRAYTVLPVCSPARASMLTGLYPHSHGVTENDGRFGGLASLGHDCWLMHQPLLEMGYRCAWFGKWHLDNHHSALDYGFEGFSLPGYGYPYATPQYQDYLRRIECTEPVVEVELPGESGRTRGTRFSLSKETDWFDYEAGTALLLGSADSHEAFFVSQLAADWLAEIGNEPFFMRVDPWGPHPPYIVADAFRGVLSPDAVDLAANFDLDLLQRPAHHRSYRDDWRATLNFDRSQWLRMAVRALEHAAQVEAALALVLNTLDRCGLAKNTFVFFCADHGDAVGSNGGVANKGGLMVEETMRIPLLVRGPGIPGRTFCSRLVSNMDVVPTILEISGCTIPSNVHAQSLVPLLANPQDHWRSGLMAEHYGLHKPAVQRAYYEGKWKLVVQEDGFQELYDLDSDPCETNNLVLQEDLAQRLEEMKAALRKTMTETGDDGPRIASILTALA